LRPLPTTGTNAARNHQGGPCPLSAHKVVYTIGRTTAVHAKKKMGALNMKGLQLLNLPLTISGINEPMVVY
jgi:hypothetical protein